MIEDSKLVPINNETEYENKSNDSVNDEENTEPNNFKEAASVFAKKNSLSIRSRGRMLEREIRELSSKKEKLFNELYLQKQFKKQNDSRYSEKVFNEIKKKQDELDETIYIKARASDELIKQAQMMDQQVYNMITGVEEREIELIKKIKYKFEKDKIIIINKNFKLGRFTTPGIRMSEDMDKLWSFNPYKDFDTLGIKKREYSERYEITSNQDFDKEILAIAESLNLMFPELLSQHTQYKTIRKMTKDFLKPFLKR